MVRYSKQREKILSYLKNSKEHPTAEQIYASLKPEIPALSLATVYRNCTQLQAAGLVQKLDTGEATARFDADTSLHAHFICSSCHRVLDLKGDLLDQQAIAAALPKDALVKNHKLYLYGTCGQCSKQ